MATSDSSTETPLKRCTKCDIEYPATREYFKREKRSKSGLASRCKTCRQNDYLDDAEAQKQRARQWYAENTARSLANSHKYQAEHSEQILEYKQRYRVEYCLEEREYSRRYYADHIEAARAYGRQYAASHRDERRIYRQQYYAVNAHKWLGYSRKYFLDKPEELRARARAFRASNPEKMREYRNRRRSQKANNGGTHTAADIRLLLRSQKHKCWWCDHPIGNDYHVDHRIPLARGGSNAPENLCISCPSCNMSKGAKLPQEWNGRLL